MTTTDAAPTARLTAVLALLSFVMPMATDMYLPAFPQMAEDLHTDASGVQLTLTTFLIGLAAGQLVLGPLSDRCGRRGLMLAGTAGCAISTGLCALAPSLGWLVALRFVAGFSGAAGIVLGRAVISDVATGAVAARLFGFQMALGGIAPIVAPLLGGAVFANAGWRAVFWVLAAAAVAMFLSVLLVVPESLPQQHRHAGGLRATLRATRSVLTNRAYLGYTIAFAFGCGALFCYIAASPFLYQKVLGMTVGESSVTFAAGALVATLSSTANVKLVDHVAPAVLLRTGLVLIAVATSALLAITLADALDRVSAIGLLAVVFVGLGMVFANATALAIACVPESAGTGSALLGTLQTALGAVAAPLMGIDGEHTAVPLFTGMTVCAITATAALLLTRADREQFVHVSTS